MTAEQGHNSGISNERLRSIVQRIERLEEDKAAVAEDIREIYAEAKGVGYNVKTVRAIVKARKIELAKRREQLELFDLYAAAIGMET